MFSERILFKLFRKNLTKWYSHQCSTIEDEGINKSVKCFAMDVQSSDPEEGAEETDVEESVSHQYQLMT